MLDQVRARGAEVFAITSQPPHKASDAQANWSLRFEQVLSDEDHVIADHVRTLGYVNLHLTQRSDYKNGMVQPGLLIITRTREILFTWAIVPTLMNIGGGTDRPVFRDVWENVCAKLEDRPATRKISKTNFFSVLPT
eukprot:m.453965 g.453965  ORF g.453965 m.453965 type:complete len:137 (+) comp56942_c0_seq1:1928-2338(+)